MKKKPAGEKQSGGIVFDGDTNVRGNVVSGEVHGNVSYSNVETNIQQGLTAQELAQIQQLFQPVRETIAHADLPENKRILGQEYADQLEKEITKKDEPPDESIIKVAGNWLLDNIPEIAGALTDLFVNPVVGKVVQGAGRVASDWVKQRFGKAQKGK